MTHLRSFTMLVLFLFGVMTTAFSQDKPAYIIYNSKGKKVSYSAMMKGFKKADVILFGEFHDNPISHWLELELTKDLHAKYKLNLGAEMMEADNQAPLNAYLRGEIDQKGLDTLARLWSNYSTDYKPLIDFAKDSGLSFTATNVPRKYARMVNKGGFEALDTLTAVEKSWIAPMPFVFDAELPRYKNILEMMGDHGSPNLVKAQATKDATMAHFIMTKVPAKNRDRKQEQVKYLHFNGAYHSDFYEGIAWYLNQINKGVSVQTISTSLSSDPNKFNPEDLGKADFIIVVDEDMTRTY